MKHRIGLYGFLVWLAVGCNVTPPNLSGPAPQTEPVPEKVIPGSQLPEKINTTNGTGDPGGTGGPEIPAPPFDGTSPLPTSLCGTGTYFSFLNVTPDPNVSLVAGMPMTIQAHVQFSLPPNTDDAIGLVVWSGDLNDTTPFDETPVVQYTPISGGATGGCNTADLTLQLSAVTVPTFTLSIVSANLGYRLDANVYYRFGNVPYIRITNVAPAIDQVLYPNGQTGSVSISLEWDMKGHQVSPQFLSIVYDSSDNNVTSTGYFYYPDIFSVAAGSGTFTYYYSLDTPPCRSAIWFIFRVADNTSGTSSDLAAAHWYFQPLPFRLFEYGPGYAQPGGPPQTGYLLAQSCTPEDQTLQFTSDSFWLTLSQSNIILPGGSFADLEYAIDATGLVPYSELQGTITATSMESGASVSSIIDLMVGDYYVPCVPQIQLYNYYESLNAQPGAPAKNYYLYIENCSLIDQTVTASSNVPWLSVSPSPIVVYVNDYAILEFSVDATGLTPANIEIGTLTVSSSETGANAESTIELMVGEYYVPPPHYIATATTFSWDTAADANNGSLALGAGQDDEVFSLALPFPFSFYGVTYSTLGICENGGILFGSSTYCPYYLGWPDEYLGPALAINWGDLIVAASGSIRYATTGSTPDRKLVISFNAVGQWPGGDNPSTFQAIFSEGSEVIKVQYGTLSYQYIGGTNYGDGFSADSWAPASNSAFLVSP